MRKLTIQEINSRKPSNSRLTVISENGKWRSKSVRHSSKILYKCICACGKETNVPSSDIVSGARLSCGCFHDEVRRARKGKPGKSKFINSNKRLYDTWKGMLARCYDSRSPSYLFYGAKGVTVCDEWKNDYQSFLDWALANGWSKGLHLDKDKKVKDNKVYSPSTCCFLTPQENATLRGNVMLIPYKGDMKSLTAICKENNVSYMNVRSRINKGFELESAISDEKYRQTHPEFRFKPYKLIK